MYSIGSISYLHLYLITLISKTLYGKKIGAFYQLQK